jgi:hypothetical protein
MLTGVLLGGSLHVRFNRLKPEADYLWCVENITSILIARLQTFTRLLCLPNSVGFRRFAVVQVFVSFHLKGRR